MNQFPPFKLYSDSRVTLGVTGSVAAYKSLELLRLLQKDGLSAAVTLTRNAEHFVTKTAFKALGADPVRAWDSGFQDDLFAHLDLDRDMDQGHPLCIAPATANIIAKIAHGLADDLLSTQALASARPLLVAPAMNPDMWKNSALQENLAVLRSRKHIIIEPGTGKVACGDIGTGRLADIETIRLHVLRELSPKWLAGKKVLVNLGPTREPLDPVRFISNPSSGKAGQAFALVAWLLGAEPLVVAGPAEVFLPAFFSVTRVRTAQEMAEAVLDLWPEADIGVFTAAVADFRPLLYSENKVKKADHDQGLEVVMERTTDILAEAGKLKQAGQLLIGFCAESGDPVPEARRKLKSKNLDLIVAVSVGEKEQGFGGDAGDYHVLDRNGRLEYYPRLPKNELPMRIYPWFGPL